MAQAFVRKGKKFVGVLDRIERSVVIDLLDQTRELVAPEETEKTGDPFTDLVAGLGDEYDPREVAGRDPVVRRILPDGHRDDPEASAEFRAATERNLREQKTRKLTAAIDLLSGVCERESRIELTEVDAVTLMMALADVRLALGERLGLRTDEDSLKLHADLNSEQALEEPRLTLMYYYEFLTWLQETISLALAD